MLSLSIYSVDCICGHHIESEATELVCPDCQRQVRIEWPAEVASSAREAQLPIAT